MGLDILCKHQLYLKAKKCMIRQSTVEYLSLILSEGHRDGPVKVASVCVWRTLRNVTKVQSFVGFINFYKCLIQDFLHMAKPLHLLTKKGEMWRWTEDKQKAFKELKCHIMSAPILVKPNQDAQFQLETETFRYVTSTVLNCARITSGT